MSAFILVDTKISNPEVYEEYKALAKPLAEKYGGTYRTRGGAMEVVENDLWSPTRLVLIEFADMEAAKKFIDSEDYAPIKAMRHANAECTLAILEGI
ncbi:DUF1330 domain-containing protein [Kiloniella laminariae]|uniref:DUF1330 domain-containing protein n=1 Tax=Kiloniella laminariae TaxID=454162 RepID=A0ABT4LH34_9PROT|nr:DUF1330 domain-containing protein [Kiloniella laminariae]MCZ4280413.1 DUF1330 domain-containing protein [Kiloniella laminariae]